MGVFGHSKSTIGGAGVWGEGEAGIGVIGKCLNQTDSAGPGVFGQSRGTGVWGESDTWMGVFGLSKSTTGGAGVQGQAEGPGPGVIGVSKAWHGVYGETQSTTGGAGVCGESTKGEGVRGLVTLRSMVELSERTTTLEALGFLAKVIDLQAFSRRY
ncbi:MAG: hypothetical protein WKG06_22335 [Segetibacter sp.]